ncbi:MULTISPECIES: hypothetical protein [Serratia]|uniref:hypothetical protein n=1 Tax=Serratia TaxID=613 RepID=UPI0004631B27|nr:MULTISPECIES: hypothetical protein [Serratia]UAN62263.1 hypothetical protein KGP16_22290 [Serratia sp. JSRIV006]
MSMHKIALLIAVFLLPISSVNASQIGKASNLDISVPIAALSTLTTSFTPLSGLKKVTRGTQIGNLEILTTGAGYIGTITIKPVIGNNYQLLGATTGSLLPFRIGTSGGAVTSALTSTNHTTTLTSHTNRETIINVFSANAAGSFAAADVYTGAFIVSVFSR